MKTVIEKTLIAIKKLEEKATVVPTKYGTPNRSNQVDDVEVQVDTSDEKNVDENSDIFSAFNQSNEVKSLKVEVEVDGGEDLSEDGSDTVFGQGTNPKPEDETYLNLLKKTTPKPKVKIKNG